jgi:hypothetical protein
MASIPVIGIVAKEILLIPHLFAMYLLNTVAGAVLLITWIPVLFTGQYPEVEASVLGGILRWQTRVAAYFLGLTDRYPPFRLAE